jgi:hypothetical protein
VNVTQHLLVCLAEECGEVAKECHKALRFGLDDQVTLDPHGPRGTEGPTNRQKIAAELNDLRGVLTLCVANGILPINWSDQKAQYHKRKKVSDYMAHARRLGVLKGDVEVNREACAACDRGDFSLGHSDECQRSPGLHEPWIQPSTTVNHGQPPSTQA